MTARERVFTCRLIQKIDAQSNYTERIGLSYEMIGVKTNDISRKSHNKNSKENK